MDSLLITVVTAVIACLLGVVIGWRFRTRHYLAYLNEIEEESGARSLELLETRQHLRKISGHLETSLKKDKTIRQLRRKQKQLQKEIDLHVLKARRREKAHFIQTAKIKLELIEARMQPGKGHLPNEVRSGNGRHTSRRAHSGNGAIADNKLTHTDIADVTEKDFGELTDELQGLLRQAGISRVRQLAGLSRQEIDQLADHFDRQTAE